MARKHKRFLLLLSSLRSQSFSYLVAYQEYQVGYRCLSRRQLLNYNCSETDIYENQPVLDVLQDKPLKDYETSDQAVQVTPQRAYLKLVKGVCLDNCFI